MKKVISIVLALLMMIPMAAMLVPTASAATVESYVPSVPDETWTYYEQNFDDPSLAALDDKALAAALGWKAPEATNTLMMQDGQLRIVAQYTPAGVYPPTVHDKWGAAYNSGKFVNGDTRMANSVTVLEYDLTYQRRAAKAENNITTKDGSKTVYADGQGTYQFASLMFSGTSGVFYSRVNLAGDVAWNNNLDITPKGGARTWGAATLARVNAMPATTKVAGFEYSNTPVVDSNTGTYTSTVVDMKMHIKAVIDPDVGDIYMYVNDILVARTSDQHRGDISKWARDYLTKGYVHLQANCGSDVLVDNIKVWGYNNETPDLVISEVAINGQGTSSNEGAYKAGVYTGDYQWVELYNPSTKAVNVYDYSLVVDTAPFGNGTFGQETELGTGLWHQKDKYSSIGYFRSGDQTFTMANGTQTTFTNPAYANGVLQPGETAMVLLPSTGLKANVAVDNETVEAYFKQKGMPEGTKVFVCDNKSDKMLEFTLDQGNILGIMKVNDADTDSVEAIGYGKSTQYYWYYESYCIVTAKGGGSGSVFIGYSVKDALGEFPTTKEGAKTQSAPTTTKNASFEISYFDWFVDGGITSLGFIRYQANVARNGIDGTAVSATPGFVPVECRAPINVTYTDVDGTETKKLERFATAVSVATPIVPGYDTRVLVNGEVVVAKATAETTTIAGEDLTSYDVSIKVELYREGSGFIGYQTTAVDEDGYYNLRLLAAVNSFEDYEKLGFRIALSDGIDETEAKEYEVQYVYTAVTAYEDGSEETVEAGDYKSNYLYALHINGISADDYAGLSISVEAIYMIDGEWQTGADGSNGFFEIVLD